jgi:putative hydrolase of the HAD superfamily
VIEVVFFDAGGTLLDPHPSFPELFAAVCLEKGHPVEASAVEAAQARIAPHLTDLVADGEDAVTYAGTSDSAKESRRYWTYFYERMLAEVGIRDRSLPSALFERFTDSRSYKLYHDVVPAIDSLQALGVRIGLISNFEGWLEKMLVELEVGDVFEIAVISGIEGIEKPDPGIYRLALERAEVSAAVCMHVGDSPVMDAAPAAEVGMHPVLIDRGDRYPDSSWPRARSLKDLPELVAKL